ncbi:MAG: efflux RND transporter periplasmic adaptor subunit, partial [Bacillati bacterium ANGP1]
VNVTEADMGTVRRGAMAEMGVDAFPNRTFHGTVARIAGGVDPDTRTVQVEVDLDNHDHALRPGMYARVRLVGVSRHAFVVPLSALVIVGGQQFVWVVSDGRVSRRAVTIGATTASVVKITSGVSPSETIVFRGTEQVREGGPVRTAPAGE